jgi:hypothetical protein
LFETWTISKSKGACLRCGVDFPPERVFYSCLVEGPDGFTRRDYCPDCWETDEREVFCFWRTCRPPEEEKRVVDTELMVEFFDRLDGAEEPEKRALRFVLALYLMRRKELRLKPGGDGECLKFERRAGGRVEVANPGLDEAQIQQTAAQLTQLLNAAL